MKLTFDRSEYLKNADVFEAGKLDEADTELCEFSEHIEDIAYELAYTRYALAKSEAQLSNTRLGLEKMERFIKIGHELSFTHTKHGEVIDLTLSDLSYKIICRDKTLADLIGQIALMEVG